MLTAARLFGFFMALKATIFKVDLSVADMDRNVYSDFALTLARHPSENDIRMMVRLFAFMLLADERLEFGKGLSTDEEPDLWLKDLTGAIDQWVVVGQPDERWLRKASAMRVWLRWPVSPCCGPQLHSCAGCVWFTGPGGCC